MLRFGRRLTGCPHGYPQRQWIKELALATLYGWKDAKAPKVVHFSEIQEAIDKILTIPHSLSLRFFRHLARNRRTGCHPEANKKSPKSKKDVGLFYGGPRWDRTSDQKIKSLLLYQLS